ncbi:MAG TPA: HD family phosphohydrolase [Bacillus bacterium]|nr:HD family phosphohydrolase [Bacillus sp. (in: firmicutes)]
MNTFNQLFKQIKNHKFIPVLLFITIAAILYVSMYSNIRPEKVDLRLFSVAKKDILSPITIEDIEATEEKKQEAVLEVDDQYILKADYAENRVEIILAIFDAVSAVKSEKVDDSQNPAIIEESIPLEKKVDLLKEMIPLELQGQLSDKNLETLLTVSPGLLDSAKGTTTTLIKQIMGQPIKVGEEDRQKEIVSEEINKVNLPENIKSVMVAIAQYAIIPNYVYDIKGTEAKRQAAMDKVNPVKIRAGQVLVKEGQVIDREMFKQLALVGLLEEQVNPNIFIGLALFVFLLTSIVAYYVKDVGSKERIMYVLIFALTILLMKGISLFRLEVEIGYIFPAAMATMLIKVLLKEKLAVISSIVFSICGSIIFNVEMLGKFNFSLGVYFLISGIAGIIFISERHYRSKILKAGLYVSVINMVAITGLFMIRNGHVTSLEIGTYLLFAFLSGFISAVLTLGLMPVFEAWFGLLSMIKLIELSSPNHPLLRKILLETPGTYHHSIMVANLSEAACETIGANGFLARVGAYYHDIGKTKRPHFYIENQMNIENPHDTISPQLSKTIITAHPYDGAELLREYKIPKEIIDIAEQHHGTTLLKYFYFKAKEQSDDIIESDFRYPGPKAQSKEAVIVGLADSVEAAVRSLSNPTPQKIENLVRSILTDRLQDGQFDECDITLKELDLAAKSICETLKGVFHSRIEYPDAKQMKKEKKVREA